LLVLWVVSTAFHGQTAFQSQLLLKINMMQKELAPLCLCGQTKLLRFNFCFNVCTNSMSLLMTNTFEGEIAAVVVQFLLQCLEIQCHCLSHAENRRGESFRHELSRHFHICLRCVKIALLTLCMQHWNQPSLA